MRANVLTGAVVACVAAMAAASAAWADASPGKNADGARSRGATQDPTQGATGESDFVVRWFARVRAAQESQPHWITPVATVTPRLEQELRFDAGFQKQGNGAGLENYGMGKGLELIPTTSNEIILNLPPYERRVNHKPAVGFGDDPVLLIKQRFASANEQEGNYIVTGFLGVQAPTGVKAFTNDAYVVTPTLAAGKGWGDFDLQGTVGVAMPLSHAHTIGASIITNVAFQYHLGEVFWPELEINSTHWTSGDRAGKSQVFLTPGIVFGRFPIAGRLKAIVGAAYQIAVSPRVTTAPVLTPTFNHQLIITTRLTF